MVVFTSLEYRFPVRVYVMSDDTTAALKTGGWYEA